MWSVLTKEFLGREVHVRGLKCARLQWSEPDASGRQTFKEIPGSAFELKAGLVLLALGFVHVEHGKIVQDLGLAVDGRGNLIVDSDWMTNVPGVFAAGDAVAGASLVVRAINQGRRMAASVDAYLRK